MNEFFFKVIRLFNIIRTKFVLYSNRVHYSNYRCYGVPYVSIDHGSVAFGQTLTMNNGLSGNQIGFDSVCVFRCDGGNIVIGDNVGISQTAMIAKGADITIGNNVKVGGGVKIYTSDFHSLNYLDRRVFETDLLNRKCAPVVIGDDCFIGAGSFILKGVKIGSRSVVGAGSVVTKSIPEDEVWAGNPAQFIKKLQ